jgi:diaminopimelate decarboxylase
VREQVRILQETLKAEYPGSQEITYAAKAYFSLQFARKIAALNLGVDVVSLGELSIAQKAGFQPERVHLHGNNKSQDELDAAIAWGVQAIVADSLEELDFIAARAAEAGKKARVWLRITPGVTVDTHPYRQTAHAASKFGLAIQGGSALEGLRKALVNPHLHLSGLHTHLGSQFFETGPFQRAIAMLMDLADECGFQPEELSPGGGWGVPYTPEDETGDPVDWVRTVSNALQASCKQKGWRLPKLIIEPGRWVTARAGLAVYSVGTSKISGDETYILAVDGGMADNPRPALYHANYTACIAERPDAPAQQDVRVVGKYCESGDELIPHVRLPEANRGEHLVIPVAGAYQLSMTSNYNLAARPEVLWLEDGQVQVLQKRKPAQEDAWWLGE